MLAEIEKLGNTLLICWETRINANEKRMDAKNKLKTQNANGKSTWQMLKLFKA